MIRNFPFPHDFIKGIRGEYNVKIARLEERLKSRDKEIEHLKEIVKILKND